MERFWDLMTENKTRLSLNIYFFFFFNYVESTCCNKFLNIILRIIRNSLNNVSCFTPFSLTGSSGDEIEMPKRRRSSLTANLPLSPPSYIERLKARFLNLFYLIFHSKSQFV